MNLPVAVLADLHTLVASLSTEYLTAMEEVLGAVAPGDWQTINARLQEPLPNPAMRTLASTFVDHWRMVAAEIPPSAMGLALQAAAYAQAIEHNRQQLR